MGDTLKAQSGSRFLQIVLDIHCLNIRLYYELRCHHPLSHGRCFGQRPR